MTQSDSGMNRSGGVVARWLTLGCGLALTSACAGQPVLTNLGVLPGGTISSASGVSADGSTVVGTANTASGDRAVRWTPSGGLEDLGVPGGFVGSRGSRISDDGAFICGTVLTSTNSQAFRWSRADGFTPFALADDVINSFGTGISNDGSSISINSVDASGRNRAQLWTLSGGVVTLPRPAENRSSTATGVSGNGTAFGSVQSFDFAVSAALWTSGVLTTPETPWPDAEPLFGALNADASAGGGWIIYPQSRTHAMRWERGSELEDLGRVEGATASLIRATNRDASMLVGYSITPNGNRALLWTRSIGLVDLNVALHAAGVDLAGWTLTRAEDLSPDANVAVGEGLFNGQRRAWILTGLRSLLPCLADFNDDQFLDFFDYLSFVECFEGGDCGLGSADFNGDGFVDFFDYAEFVDAFETGC